MEDQNLKIVVIDDNSDNLATFISTVERALPGTGVFTASTGMQGVELARTIEPDIILIDISMTENYGAEASGVIKLDKMLKMTPILFITDFEADRQLHIKAIEEGAEAFLLRPLDDTILVTQLKAMAKIKERNILICTQNERLEALVEIRTRELKKEIIERRKSEEELRKSEEKFKKYIEMSPLGIFVLNGTGRYVDANETACRLIGYSRPELLSLSITDYLLPEFDEVGQLFFNEIKAKGYSEGELKVRDKNGIENWLSFSGAKINEDCLIVFCRNITQRKEREQRIEYLSYHDVLTGIHNRAYYEEAVSRLDTEEQLPLAIITCDFNGLKLVNDTLGHAFGDSMLVETAKILSRYTRTDDELARMGGDEFSILLPKTGEKEVQMIADSISAACREFETDAFKHSLPISLSLGYAIKTTASESFAHVAKKAEDYMYKHKLLERDSFHSSLMAALRTTLFERSHEAEEHAERLAVLSRELGKELNLQERELDELELLSVLHDIGKISIDNSILTKPGKLTDEERLEMNKHSAIGYRIALASPELKTIAEHILGHHERWDGNGYPQGISGESIPLLSRILSVVDAYDAMTQDRTYRKAMSKEAAAAEIARNAGTQFDPVIAALFLKKLKEKGETEIFLK